MSDRPMIFSAPMIRALREGRKTQTRRHVHDGLRFHRLGDLGETAESMLEAIYWRVGDRAWVREAWGRDWYDDGQTRAWKYFVYKADNDKSPRDNGDDRPWSSPIHMPRRASRITLTVTGVRVQRLQDISTSDCISEGIPEGNPWRPGAEDEREAFRALWESIHGDGAWALNPWVAALSFTVALANIDTLPKVAAA